MRKMILLAAMATIAALMMAAAPAFAQQQGNLPAFREVDDFLIKPGDCGIGEDRFGGEQLTREETLDLRGVDEDELPGGGGVPKFCVIFPDDNNGNGNGNGNGDGDGDGDGRDNRDNDVVPVFEITQDFEQEAESGDIDQSFDVSQTGDNSNQTVGINGTANTGNLQTQTGFIDAGGFGDFDGNNDDDERFFFVDDFCDFGDFDGDGICDRLDRLEERFEDRCEDGNNDGICDRLEEKIEDLEDRIDGGFFFVVDDDSDNDRFFGGNDGGDFEFEDIGSDLTVSGDNVVTSDQQVNQAATAFGK